jgi:hypothetical protein
MEVDRIDSGRGYAEIVGTQRPIATRTHAIGHLIKCCCARLRHVPQTSKIGEKMAYDPIAIRAAVSEMVRTILRGFEPDSPECHFVLREMLKTLIWKHTEALDPIGSKYVNCPIWSRRALNSYIESGELLIELEHVVTRASLNEALRAPGAIDHLSQVFSVAVTCVVTVDEHRLLKDVDKQIEGWDRYKGTGILVAPIPPGDRLKMRNVLNVPIEDRRRELIPIAVRLQFQEGTKL